MQNQLKSFLAALGFLTTLPMARQDQLHEAHFARALYFYPLVGLFIGLILWLLSELLSSYPSEFIAIMVLLVWVALSGLLHYDGLADSADALVGGVGDRDKTLQIMKDVHNGAAAQVALSLFFIAKYVAIHLLIQQQQAAVIILAPVIGRLSVLVFWQFSHYVSASGLASRWQTHLREATILQVITLSLVLSWLFAPLGLKMTITVAVFWFLYLKFWDKRIGGITGDVLGAGIVLTELLVLLAAQL